MKKTLTAVIPSLILALFFISGTVLAGMPAAPDFTLQDINGKTVSFRDFKGKNVLLDFTTTWCPYCKREVPEMRELYQKYKGKLEIIAIDMNESKAKVTAFVEKYKVPYTTLLDTEGKVAMDYGIMGVPTKVLVGKDGKVFCYMCRNLEKEIEDLLKKK
jgi:peroxiredoxin